jgi:hypothetical protein
MPLNELCIDAAEAYLDFLGKNNKGVIEHHVVNKVQAGHDIWRLTLNRGLRNADEISVRIGGQLQDQALYQSVEYDPDTRVLVIKINGPWPSFVNAHQRSIVIISDMRFIVARVQQWFHQFGNLLQMPAQPARLQPPANFNLTGQQTAAVASILGKPVSFIWGPPGTGKTKKVLAAAVVAHVRAGNTVMVLAPTNNALDLAMSGLIEACHSAGVARNLFIRLGTPGHMFAEQYSEQCEVKGIQVALDAAHAQMRRLERHLAYHVCLSEVEEMQVISQMLSEYATHLHAKLELDRMIEEDSQAIARLEARASQVFNRLLGGLTGASQEINDQWTRHYRNLEARKGERLRVDSLWIDSQRALNGYQRRTNLQLEPHLLQVTDDVYGATARANHARELLAQAQARLNDLNPDGDLRGLSGIEIKRRMTQTQQRIHQLEQLTLEVRLHQVRVIGLTLDHYIGYWAGNRPPLAQVFLDEAAYTPLIKALTLFRGNVPVAMLGDDRQLPPVCEANPKQMQAEPLRPCLLWARSAPFVELALNHRNDPDDLHLLHILVDHPHRPPPFQFIARQTLTVSYRFGPNLAHLLGELIYDEDGIHLTAANQYGDLQIQVIHAPRSASNDWTSEAQAQAVRAHVQNRHADFAVLAPYKNQVRMIQHQVGHHLSDRVMTVNAAQGQEWDTVIFCASDCGKDPFLTDSTIPQGKATLNTAISRAKHCLVLVLDRNYWRQRPHQLLSRLMLQAV